MNDDKKTNFETSIEQSLGIAPSPAIVKDQPPKEDPPETQQIENDYTNARQNTYQNSKAGG